MTLNTILKNEERQHRADYLAAARLAEGGDRAAQDRAQAALRKWRSTFEARRTGT